MKTKKKIVQVVKDVEIVGHVFASEIRDISKAARDLRASQLKEKTILILLSHSSGVNQGDIKRVLESMELLEKEYLK